MGPSFTIFKSKEVGQVWLRHNWILACVSYWLENQISFSSVKEPLWPKEYKQKGKAWAETWQKNNCFSEWPKEPNGSTSKRVNMKETRIQMNERRGQAVAVCETVNAAKATKTNRVMHQVQPSCSCISSSFRHPASRFPLPLPICSLRPAREQHALLSKQWRIIKIRPQTICKRSGSSSETMATNCHEAAQRHSVGAPTEWIWWCGGKCECVSVWVWATCS